MRILKVHEYYTQHGGEDTVFQSETALLRSKGHEVIEYIESNQRIKSMSKSSVAIQTVWSAPAYKEITKILKQTQPDIVHFHNTFPLISPSAYYACHELKIPLVQTLDNQRLICPASSFYRNGKLCLDCLGRIPAWPGVLHACYHGSYLHSGIVVSMVAWHRLIGTWQTMVDSFLCSTNFYRELFVQAGIPSNKIVVMPHFVQPPYQTDRATESKDYALFVGRLDPEKGINTLLEAWQLLEFPLKIRGSGRLDEKARAFVDEHQMGHVQFVDRLDEQELSDLIRNARFLIMPSEGYYETFGLVIIEAYSRGVPVLASNIGVTPELVADSRTGLLFEAGNPRDLAEKAKWLWGHPKESNTMGANGYNLYKERFTPDQCYETLITLYKKLIDLK